MIGLGKWSGEINTPVISGTAVVDIKEINGQYDFSVAVSGMSKLPDFSVYDIREDGNCLSGKADIALMGKITVDIFVEIHGDTFTGYIKVPFFEKIQIENGRKIG